MEEMPPEAVKRLIEGSRFGHLALAKNGRSYVVPLFFGYDGRDFFFHSHEGLKDEYITATEEACFVVTRVESLDDWESVLAFGSIAEVTDDAEKLRASDALMSVPLPPEFGVTSTGEPARSEESGRFLKLTPARLTGRASHRPPPNHGDEDMETAGM